MIDRLDPEKMSREEFDRMLDAPLPGVAKKKPTAEQLEREGRDFMAFNAAFGGGG